MTPLPVPPPGPATRPWQNRRAVRSAVGGLALVAAYLVADALLPGHVPPGIVLKGVVLGGLQAMVAMGLVLLYRSARIVNFAQSAIGLFGLTVAVVCISGEHLPYALAVPAGVAAAVVLGWGIARLMRRFAESSRMIVTVATIGLAELLNAANVELPRAVDLRSNATFNTPFSFQFTVRPLAFTGDALVALGAVAVVLVALWVFLQRTETGVAIRAAADNRERALLLGIPVVRLSTVTWMVAGGLAGVGAVLAAPISGVGVGAAADPSTLLAPLAAAVLAGMESLPLTLVWSLVLGVVDQAAFWSFHSEVYSQLVFLLLVMVAMLVRTPARGRRVPDADAPPGADRVAGPMQLAAVPVVRWGRRAGLAALAAVAALVPLACSASTVVAFQYVAIYAILALSLVVLSGWAGQISLAQYAFAGIGAAVTGTLLVHAHLPFPLAMVAAAAVGGVVACILGLPALRLRGLNLAVATMAFAVPVSSWLLSPSYVSWLNPMAPDVRPPVLFRRFWLGSPWTLYEVCLLALVACMWLVHNLRRSRTGRVAVAVRDNPRAAAAYGISPLRTRLLAFTVSGALAGVAGALIVVSTSGMPSTGFAPSESINVFAMAVIGGLGSVTGAVAGAVYAQGFVHFLPQVWQYVADGGGLLLLLMVMPEGLGGALLRARGALDTALAGRLGAAADEAAGSGGTSYGGRPDGDRPDGDRPDRDRADGGAPGSGTGDGRAASGVAHTAALRMAALEDLEVAEQVAGDSSAPDARPEGRPSVVELDGVSVRFGTARALVDVSLGVAQSEVLALLGTNGAGKSTALRVVAGLVRPERGAVRLLGEDVTRSSPADRVAAGVATVLGGRSVFPSLSVLDNLRMGAWTVRHRHGDLSFVGAATARVLDLFPALRLRLHQPAGLLSGGEQQMLALAQSLLCRPKVLLVDELSLGLAPATVAAILDVLRGLTDSGVTVVVVEQSVNVATAISRRAVFMERGRVRFSGSTPDLTQQPTLLRSVFLHAADRAGRRRPVESGAAGVPDVADLIAGLAVADPSPAADGLGPPATLRSVDDVAAVLAGLAPGTAFGGAPEPRTPVEPPGPAGGRPVPVVAAALSDTLWAAPGRRPAAAATAAATAAFAVVDVTRRFGGVTALRDVSLHVARGEILGVIGSNGAGKTTLFDVCSGFDVPDEGRVFLHGRDVTGLPPAARARLGLGRVFQDVRLWPTMTLTTALSTALERRIAVRDPLAGALGLVEVADAEADVERQARRLLRQFGLERFAERTVGDLSTGMRRIAELACAVAHRPSVLLLDEPTAGIAQREAGALGELILGLRDETGAAFVVIEHDVPLVSSVADRLVCMHVGEVIAEGSTDTVLQDPAVVASYLASADDAGGALAGLVGAGSPR